MNWLRRLLPRPRCEHDWHGAANFYDRDRKVYLQLLYCERCSETVIEVIHANPTP